MPWLSALLAVTITAPVPYQVVQRGSPIPIRAPGATHWRVVALTNAFGASTDWAPLPATKAPAGGWYRLEVRAGNETASVEPVGVGEVFLIAGQSYAANCNDERLKVTEPQQRVTCLDPATGAWRVADDPQPGASNYKDGGSIWPPFGDELAKRLRVPVGFANVAWQGTSSVQWLPGGNHHQNLVQAAKQVGAFRAVLWQQGESDVIAGTPADKYVANIQAIRAALLKECGFEVPWLPAKSTSHPTVYNNPKQEAVIRQAVDNLWKTQGFFRGPDTDTLTGENRGGANSCQHFSATGQRRAAALWVEAVSQLIRRP
jgi:hypothetical protein